MLYLARVQKKSLFGQAELQLLARQADDQVWSPVRPTDPPLMSSEASTYNVGVLLLITMNAERRISALEEAAPKLVDLLCELSTSGERSLALSEIEQWRQSLTRQSQQLSLREAEVEARQEQLQQWENALTSRYPQAQKPKGMGG